MKSPTGKTHYVRQRHHTRTTKPASRVMCLVVSGIALFACVVAPMSNAAQSSRFEITGSGTLVLDQPLQKSGNVQLKATLVPTDVASPVLPKGQAGGGFTLTANLAAASMACYNDTIFRDDFDGDGL
jgi:hypothetical protein